ncbi:MAG: hypothetical protein QHI38_05235 [Armatimonadota bacterium]|nr:hypothetical protein [Armatimonadota bacterium]
MQKIKIGNLEVSRFILGGNPFSGFSHQSPELDRAMVHYFTVDRIKRVLREAESLGINTLVARADNHIVRVLIEYWDEGGKIQWIAQTAPEMLSIQRGIENAIKGGASACYIHGGVMDQLFETGRLDEVAPAIDMIRQAGIPAGIAAHNPEVHKWADRELDIDFHMCSYYNPAPRKESAEIRPGTIERFQDSDRDAMVETIRSLSSPAIHYKILGAGRKDPADAFAFAVKHLRPCDAVCVGIYDEHKSNMLREDVELFEQALAAYA